ncbi:MAG: hypothetical protein EBU66_09690 [Bacteroidetes bacterium]|nr:hypothetical protein [bacterium]NBP64914.1 hypothetical protein [Bacteroidota bacterium]
MSTSCFPLGIMKGLTYRQLLTYSMAVSTFKRVEAYNANIFALRRAGDSSQQYYIFKDSTEETAYTQGRFLLAQNDPKYFNYTPVQKI